MPPAARRPSLGTAIVRGLHLWSENLKMRMDHGLVPYNWTKDDRDDAKAAVQYMGRLSRWVADRWGGWERLDRSTHPMSRARRMEEALHDDSV